MQLIRIAAAAAVLALAPRTITAQVITACYVPNTGTVYRIKEPKTPAQCSNKHIEFSWNAEGPAGPAGPQGPAGMLGHSLKETDLFAVAPGTTNLSISGCSLLDVVVGGGFSLSGSPELSVRRSEPYVSPYGQHGWLVAVHNASTTTTHSYKVFVVCVRKPPQS